MDNSTQESDLRSRYTPNAELKKRREIGVIRAWGTCKLVVGGLLTIGGIAVMLADEALLPAGFLPLFYGLVLVLTGILNVGPGKDLDEFPRFVEIGVWVLPLVVALLMLLAILQYT